MKPRLYDYEIEDLKRDIDILRVIAGALDALGASTAADSIRGASLRIRSVLPRLEFEAKADKTAVPGMPVEQVTQ